MGKVPGSIHGVIAANGGIVPRTRQRSTENLSRGEREEISRGLARKDSVRTIAARLTRSPSTVSREVNRNGGPKAYRAERADERAWEQARRPKPCRLRDNETLREVVAAKLADDWSPQQISGWLARQYGRAHGMYVSHETIYRSLFIQARGVLRKELTSHLRTWRTMRRAKAANTEGQRRGQIRDAISIRERPGDVEDRAVPGHWEGDLIAGTNNSYIATLVERHSRYVMLVRVPSKDTATVVTCLSGHIRTLPDGLMTSLTWDRGTELAQHQRFTIATDVAVYFCDPQSPWQRGSNENTNGLLRQYLPRKTDLSRHNQKDLDAIAAKLNSRPRKTLDYATPADKLASVVALTG
jgi:IS30 family transposase